MYNLDQIKFNNAATGCSSADAILNTLYKCTSGLFFTIDRTALRIPIEIRDDDDIPLVGRSTDIDSINFSLGLASSIYNSVYVDVKLDGGGNILNNERDISFYKNIDSETIMPSGAIIVADAYSYHLDSLLSSFQGRSSFGRNLLAYSRDVCLAARYEG